MEKSCYRILIFNKRLPFHSGLNQNRKKMESIIHNKISYNRIEVNEDSVNE